VKRTNEDDHDESAGGTGSEKDRSGNDGEESGTDESTDGEGDETVGEKFGTVRVRDSSVVGVVEEEGTDGDLGTNVDELSDETSDGSDLLPEWLVELVVAGVLGVGNSLGLGSEILLRDFGKLGEEEGEGDRDTETSDSHVDVLNRSNIVLVCTTEEELGGDQRSREGSDTVET
jgi:hypothetical protein